MPAESIKPLISPKRQVPGIISFMHLAFHDPHDQGRPTHQSVWKHREISLKTETLFMETIVVVCGLPEFSAQLLETPASHPKKFSILKPMLVEKTMQE